MSDSGDRADPGGETDVRGRIPAVLALCASAASHGAEVYPDKPVRLIVSFGPGSTVDLIGRVMAQQFSDQLGRSFIVDNRFGAGGSIGNGIAARATPDGYTLLFGETSLTMLPGLMKSLTYDVLRELAPVSQVVRTPMVLVVHPGMKAGTLKELVALAHAQPGKLNYASAGPGSPVNLATELFRTAAKADIAHVPYKSAGEMVTSVLNGQTQMLLTTMPTVLSQIHAGRLRALAVTTDGKRVPVLPDVPSIAEAGLPGMTIYTWSGLFVPAGVPQAIVARLHAETVKAIAARPVQERFNAEGAEPVGSTPQAFAAHVRAELKRWAEVIRAAGLQAQ